MTSAMLTGNRSHALKVRGHDFYATPYAGVAALLHAEGDRLPKRIWEPACGNGAIVIPLRNRGYDVIASDLNDWGCPESESGHDFLKTDPLPLVDYGIVTNPPFKDIVAFTEKACELAPYVALLVRLAFLESESRFGWFEKLGLARAQVIAERLPMMHRHGYDGPKLSSAGMCFAWFIFDRRPRGAPLYWRSWKEAVRAFPHTQADDPPTAKDQTLLFFSTEAA